MPRLAALTLLTCLLIGCTNAVPTPIADTPASPTAALATAVPTEEPAAPEPQPCPVTAANGETPPGETPDEAYHGNGELWTVLWVDGQVLIPAVEGEQLAMKFPWWRAGIGALVIEGHRLDAPDEPLQAEVPEGYGDTGFQATGLIFPSEGCWEVTGHVGEDSLTFVTEVVRIEPEAGP